MSHAVTHYLTSLYLILPLPLLGFRLTSLSCCGIWFSTLALSCSVHIRPSSLCATKPTRQCLAFLNRVLSCGRTHYSRWMFLFSKPLPIPLHPHPQTSDHSTINEAFRFMILPIDDSHLSYFNYPVHTLRAITYLLTVHSWRQLDNVMKAPWKCEKFVSK